MSFFTHSPETRIQRELLDAHRNNLAHLRRRVRESATVKERSKAANAPDFAVLQRHPTYLLRHTRSAPGSVENRRRRADDEAAAAAADGLWTEDGWGRWTSVWHADDEDDEDDDVGAGDGFRPDATDYYDQFQVCLYLFATMNQDTEAPHTLNDSAHGGF
eukprot:TRINITY_DN4712_c0_g1_i4.p1 TRINITY_DN4712_c0_g1~~TRINITY_DN4712_c0_g1_i4.p1  ORF type:complete len:160 (-),score=34.83 TRINITY_DN4712_c0_g1_i4:315-794(-)